MKYTLKIGDVFVDSVNTVICVKGIEIHFDKDVKIPPEIMIECSHKIPTSNDIITETLPLKNFIEAVMF